MIEPNTLPDILLRHAPEPKSIHTPIKGFRIARRDTTNIIERCLLKPIVLVTVQGKKRIIVSKIPYEYGAGQSFVIGMDLPGDSVVLEASPEKPYLSMVLELDTAMIAKIATELSAAELPIAEPRKEYSDTRNTPAVGCSETDPAVFEAFSRLAELLDKPDQVNFLAPMIIREIHYRLLISPLGRHIMAINKSGTRLNRIAGAISLLEGKYKEPLKVEDMAERANMSVSAFHRNFKLITALSPLQFQKKLRLLEAQRLMLTEGVDAANAAYLVGYESPTQFNREYKRMFGNPPAKDIKVILSQAS